MTWWIWDACRALRWALTEPSLFWTAGARAVRQLPFEALCPLNSSATSTHHLCLYARFSGSQAQNMYLFRISSDRTVRGGCRAVHQARVTIPRWLERPEIPYNCGPGSDLCFACLREMWVREIWGRADYGMKVAPEGKWDTLLGGGFLGLHNGCFLVKWICMHTFLFFEIE